MTPEFVSLFVRDLSLNVRLGCSAEERKTPQEIRVGAEIQFLRIPEGAVTDDIQDTICYAEISSAFHELCQNREFALVEKLGRDLFAVLRNICGEKAKIALSVHKVAPPVNGLLGGVVCRLGDFA